MVLISITFVYLCLHAAYTNGSGPDHSGQRYVLAFMPNYNIPSLDVFISTSRSSHVNVSIYTPFAPGNEKQTMIKYGFIFHKQFNSAMVSDGTGYKNNTIVIEADDDLLVYGMNRVSASTDGFLVLPIDVLGNEYYAIAWDKDPAYHINYIQLISIYNNTIINIKFPDNDKVQVQYKKKNYLRNMELQLPMQEFQTFQIKSSNGGLTSTYIVSTKPIAVFSGTQLAKIGKDGAGDHLCEQLIPVNRWGKSLFMVSTPERKSGQDFFVILNSEPNTTLNIKGVKHGNPYQQSLTIMNVDAITLSYGSETYLQVTANKPIIGYQFIGGFVNGVFDPSMITLPSIPQFSSDYIFELPKRSDNSEFMNYFLFIISKKDHDGLLLDNMTFHADFISDIEGTDFVSGYKILSPGKHIVRHKSPIVVFQGIIMGTKNYESYGFPIGMRLAPLNEVCYTTRPVAGDLLDNDCDGRVDEEMCGEDGIPKDEDGDGLVDEDCAIDFNKKEDISCGAPSLKPNSYIKDPKLYYSLGVELHIECKRGFFTMDQKEFACVGRNKWNGTMPTCHEVSCDQSKLIKGNGLKILQNDTAFYYNDSVTVVCDTGYFSKDNHKRLKSLHVCQHDGTWNNSVLKCTKIKYGLSLEPNIIWILTGIAIAVFALCSGICLIWCKKKRHKHKEMEDTFNLTKRDHNTAPTNRI